jgi:hypothetical protein
LCYIWICGVKIQYVLYMNMLAWKIQHDFIYNCWRYTNTCFKCRNVNPIKKFVVTLESETQLYIRHVCKIGIPERDRKCLCYPSNLFEWIDIYCLRVWLRPKRVKQICFRARNKWENVNDFHVM